MNPTLDIYSLKTDRTVLMMTPSSLIAFIDAIGAIGIEKDIMWTIKGIDIEETRSEQDKEQPLMYYKNYRIILIIIIEEQFYNATVDIQYHYSSEKEISSKILSVEFKKIMK